MIEERKKPSYHLKNLFLDPNNYRFVDNDNYKKINEENIKLDNIQKRTRTFIEGKKRENIKDLITSFKSNGFLDIDVIQVKEIAPNNFLVLEGNRRVATLKALQEDFEEGMDIGKLDPKIFKSVPIEVHKNNEEEKHLIIMGLKHISGNKKWPPVNQAKLIYDFLKPYKINSQEYYDKERDLCGSLGISMVKLRSTQRTYHLILEYKRSDYGDQFKSEMYSIFVETSKKNSIKDWIEWNDKDYSVQNINNLYRLFSWISIDSDGIDENENEDEWSEITEPIITKGMEIRDLAQFITNEEALKSMEENRSVSRGLLASGIMQKLNYSKALSAIDENLDTLLKHKSLIGKESSDEIKEIEEIQKKIINLFPNKKALDFTMGNHSTSFEFGSTTQFSELKINKYKVFNNFKLDKLKRVNILTGLNNSGKTSLLEAIYLLTKQNDISAYFNLLKLKNKLTSVNASWLNQNFDHNIDIFGIFNHLETDLKIDKFEALNIDKKDDYIASYKIKARLERRPLETTIHTFGYETVKRESEKVEHLCNSSFKSPYIYNFKEIFKTHTSNLEQKINGKTALDFVMEFMKEIDGAINNIALTDSNDTQRFIVDSKKYKEKNIDLTSYGEGIQRIFEIALGFAYSRNGVILIDEFETAIHYSLLIKFSKFIQELAIKFNVQVFITSHSKECVDSFVKNKFSNEDISLYLLENDKGNIITKYINGDEMEYLVETRNLDIRGGDNE